MKILPHAGFRCSTQTALRQLVLALAGLMICYCCGVTTVYADPVTLRFNAKVGPTRSGDVPIDLPFSFAEGDTIFGTFTFEPDNVASDIDLTETVQNFAVTFEIGGHSFGTSNYALVSVNDTPVLTEPLGDVDPPPSDAMALACSLAAVDTCGSRNVGGPGSAEFDFFLRIVGNDTILDGADFPSEPSIWNAFDSERRLILSFREPATNEFGELIANVNSFARVPEPGAMSLAVTVLTALLCHRSWDRTGGR